tara:strand:+ start:2070 stop:2789 length:720 start_codon:yes stop_codon:yes gene_type:complete
MFNSWLKGLMTDKDSNTSSNTMHEVLGTNLRGSLKENEEEILFGCGCFWGAEKGFWKLPGVITTAVGYAGGTIKNPSYHQICTGKTGHAEVVRVVWDKSLIDLSDLLKLFWECHNPTQGNRQGNDHGSQYRSAIYTNKLIHTEMAIASKESYEIRLINKGYNKITTEIKENIIFYFAEDYHQQYLAKPGSRKYCSAMPTSVPFETFKGSNFKLSKEVWKNYDWKIQHCVLRSSIDPILL